MHAQVLPFWLSGHRLALTLETVVRVLPALVGTPLPGAPATVSGLVNVRGSILPVIDLARRFDWDSPPAALWQPYLWLQTQRRQLVVPVDAVETVAVCVAEDFQPAPHPSVPSELLSGVVRTAEGLLLIQDVERLLSESDEALLDSALQNRESADDSP